MMEQSQQLRHQMCTPCYSSWEGASQTGTCTTPSVGCCGACCILICSTAAQSRRFWRQALPKLLLVPTHCDNQGDMLQAQS